MWENLIKLVKDNSGWVLGFFGFIVTSMGVWIGILQYKLSKIKYREDSFDKNYKYFLLCENFIYKILYGWITITECTDFVKDMKPAEYLFNKKVNEFINKLVEAGFGLARFNENIKVFQRNESILTDVNRDDRKKLMREKSELLKQAEPFIEELKTVYCKYLKVK